MSRLLTYIRDLHTAFWVRVSQSTYVNPSSLGIFRIITGSFLLYYFSSYTWLTDLPQAFFKPPILSIANWFDGFPSYHVFRTIDVFRLLLSVAVIVGLRTRIAILLWVILTVFAASFQFSIGKIDHDSALLLAMLVILSFSGWGKHLAIMPDKESRYDATAGSLSVFAVVICWGMFTAGYGKALAWIDFDTQTSGFASWYYLGLYDFNRDALLATYVPQVPFRLYEIMDYSAVILELSPLFFLLIGRKSWLIWLLTASLFHLGNVLLLNIPFANHFLVYLVFVDLGSLRKWITDKKNIKILTACILVIFSIHLYFLTTQRHYWGISELLPFVDRTLFELYSALLLWMGLPLVIIRSLIHITKKEREPIPA